MPDELGEADRVPADDVLDAAAAAWSAHRIAQGAAGRIPEVPELDTEGRAVETRFSPQGAPLLLCEPVLLG